ncbi:hypothetical protein YB2330_005735 [Saitoella coloradoensis]
MRSTIGPAIVLTLACRAYLKGSLSTSGSIAAAIVGIVTVSHPYSANAWLLTIFYLTGTALTRYKQSVKETTVLADVSHTSLSEKGKKGPARTWVQVLANSITAVTLGLIHHIYVYDPSLCFGASTASLWNDVLLVGILAHYACATADTYSSELGILSTTRPVSILNLQSVPPGFNGGVSALGLFGALMGGLIMGVLAMLTFPVCASTNRTELVIIGILSGLGGSLLDSLLGATLQATALDKESMKVIEAHGGKHAKMDVKTATSIGAAWGNYLNNNQVNLASSVLTSLTTMAVFAAYRST